jgi:hydrogenase/urease accessory protein HupE
MRAALTVVAILVCPGLLVAHPAPFSYLDLRLAESSNEGALVVHDFDVAHDLGVNPPEALANVSVAEKYREPLTRLLDSRLTIMLDGVRQPLQWVGLETLPERQSLRLTFKLGAGRVGSARVTAVLFPYDPIHQTFVNVYENGALRHQAILDGNRTSVDYYAGSWQGAAAVLAVFVPSGIEHILIGPDHVLFLIGLLLLGGSSWQLVKIVTAFTLGHSITLSLAALNVLSPPASVIEPAIALSIVFVGADNLLVHRDSRKTDGSHAGGHGTSKPPRDIRPLVAAVFGLIHGFGFATVLKAFGLPITALGWSLFSFNLGVEIGQLAIVLVVAWVLASVRRHSETLGRRLVVIGSVAVIAAGGYWFIERVFLTPAV